MSSATCPTSAARPIWASWFERYRRACASACLPLIACLLTVGSCQGASVGAAAWADASPTVHQAARFLTQATFGPTPASIERVQALGFEGWIDEQLTLPASESLVSIGQRLEQTRGKRQFFHGFWNKALSAPDQLRHRVAFALSEIFVVSLADSCGANHGLGVDSYHDLLAQQAFGPYRSLLERVTLHPVMGCYLSHLKNQREDLLTGRVPDENYAREVMQLFSIGLVMLDVDGTVRLDAHGQAQETYGPDDVSGLARVFTGWSWACPQWPSEECFKFRGGARRLTGGDPWTQPMVPYARHHSVQEKRFLGVSLPATPWGPDAESDLKVALDVLSAHPNVAPFLSRQLIQRLVTSNPEPAYVARVAGVFQRSGGDLGQTVKAILLDPQARGEDTLKSPGFGKIREPVLRLSAFLRAFHARSHSGEWLIGNTGQAASQLAQAPYQAPSVFNFFRPGYVPPGSQTAQAGLRAPELQITDETSMAGYATFMQTVIWAGTGEHVRPDGDGLHPADVKCEYHSLTLGPLQAMALAPPKLVDLIDTRLLYGQMSPTLRATLVQTIDTMPGPSPSTTEAQRLRMADRRLWTALLLTVVSPEFLIQH